MWVRRVGDEERGDDEERDEERGDDRQRSPGLARAMNHSQKNGGSKGEWVKVSGKEIGSTRVGDKHRKKRDKEEEKQNDNGQAQERQGESQREDEGEVRGRQCAFSLH